MENPTKAPHGVAGGKGQQREVREGWTALEVETTDNLALPITHPTKGSPDGIPL